MKRGDEVVYIGSGCDGISYGDCFTILSYSTNGLVVKQGLTFYLVHPINVKTKEQMRMDTIAGIINS